MPFLAIERVQMFPRTDGSLGAYAIQRALLRLIGILLLLNLRACIKVFVSVSIPGLAGRI